MAIDANMIGRLLRGAVKAFGKLQRSSAPPRPHRGRGGAAVQGPDLSSAYPGDFRGTARIAYAPKPDGEADPGEVVWTWVPYEEDYSQGKDRPVLLVGHNGGRLLALMMTTRDRNNGEHHDADYVDVGTGPWDRQRRPSEVKLDRILQVDPRDIRREGAVLAKTAFDRVAEALRRRHGWN
ncbi:type II toxin-antitoxin system PemK/MazF family toxin [Crystallibacter crystallopoietes]|nr:type II toxin-antitoxin system PemK/MazF family toxin [Arthrobacter crystallopoietes]